MRPYLLLQEISGFVPAFLGFVPGFFGFVPDADPLFSMD